jgi:hypothetical protein
MAHSMSLTYAQKIAFPHLAHLHALIALRKPIQVVRSLMRYVDTTEPLSSPVPEVTRALEDTAAHYASEHWAYSEGIFNTDFHRALIAGFPKRRYLDSPKSIYKSYDIGFKWERGKGGGAYLERHPAFSALLGYFCSDAFGARMTAYSRAPHPLACRAFLVTRTYPGSLVIPHVDDPIPPEFTPYINMIFFLDGTGGGQSGELTLARDNEYRDIVFTPPHLTNSCLLYDTEAPYYHGFPPIAWGKYRLAITASFAHQDYVPQRGVSQ